MKRPCIERGCILTATGTRCPAHQREHERKRGTRQQRGLGADHDAIRRQVLTEEYTCWLCGKAGTPSDPLTADHVVPRSRGGTNVRENYRAAHRSCNSARQDDIAQNLSRGVGS